MASPLRWFRRHSKILMVVLGSAAMAIFGLGPVFDTLARGGRGSGPIENQVLARWNGGEIMRTDVNSWQQAHFQTQRFLQSLQMQAMEIKKDEYRSLAQPIAPLRNADQASQADIDEQLIERFMLAQKAEKEGIVVSDGVIDDYLALLSSYAGFSKNELVIINQKANQGQCSVENVRRHLKVELLAQQMRLYSSLGLPTYPNPLESAQLYQQLTERVECEVLPVSVEEFFDKLKEEPPKLELKKLYEEGKFDYPDPTGKKPGFKMPNKVAVQYLTADFETFMANEMNKLTDEQVQTEYDRLVKENDNMVMELVPEEPTDGFKTSDPPPALPGEEAEKAERDSIDGPPEPPADDSKIETPEAGDSESSDDDPAVKKSEIESENEPPSESEPKVDGQSLIVRENKNRLVSVKIAQEEEKQGSENDSADKPEATDKKESQAETAPEEKPATAAKETEKESSNAEPATPETKSTADESAQDVAPKDESEDDIGSLFADKKEPEHRVLPLKDVVDRVKRNMVQKDAFKAMDEATKKVTATMTAYHMNHMKYELTDEAKRGDAPEPVNLKELADRYNLIANETSLLNFAELSESSFGVIDIPIRVEGPDGRPNINFITIASLIFDRFDNLKTFDPQTSQDMRSNNRYAYWLKDKQDAKIPEFEDCEADVVKFWKSRRAVELAKEEAQKIAATVNDGQKKLSELYPERASATGEFSWFNTLGGTLYGEPQSVDKPGEDFMKTVFKLKKGGTEAAANEPKTIVYVVQMLSDRSSIAEMGTEFIEKKYLPTKTIPREVGALSQFYGREINLEWNEEFAQEMGLKFYGR